MMRNFEGMAEGNGVTMTIEPFDGDLNCYFDEMRLRQIISNIISNAIKYNRPNGSVTVRFESNENCVRVFIQDTGNGIPSDQFDKVFNEFETLGQTMGHHKGTGLGMPISRRLVEGMGGRLMLDSIVDIGSTFWVEIPKTKVLDPELYRPRPDKSGDLAAA
jgi:signal transduction histidine kinase